MVGYEMLAQAQRDLTPEQVRTWNTLDPWVPFSLLFPLGIPTIMTLKTPITWVFLGTPELLNSFISGYSSSSSHQPPRPTHPPQSSHTGNSIAHSGQTLSFLIIPFPPSRLQRD